MLVDPESSCPCGSTRAARACCFSEGPPVLASGARIDAADIDATVIDAVGRPHPLPAGMSAEIRLSQPYQVDPDIDALHRAFVELLKPARGLHFLEQGEWVAARSRPVNSYAESLYSVRYHQRQFLFRLGRVTAEQHFDFRAPRGNVGIEMDDRPLRVEFEAFLLRVSSSMDALAKMLCILLDRSPRNYGPLQSLLKTDSSMSTPIRETLAARLRQADRWVVEVRDLRNQVAHDAELRTFRGVSHRGLLIADAEIVGVPAGGFVVRTWRDLLVLGRACRDVLAGSDRYQERPGAKGR